ncbi:hypothetical protein EDB80DRAFT_593693 [Ilyonectria destructans]|nr:hypothetical protein EDB80DRAFT_593693 [Ilyonectria destructans]
MTLANDSMAWTGRYPGRLQNDVLNKVSFVLPILHPVMYVLNKTIGSAEITVLSSAVIELAF